jgi:hypothetical protein
LIKAGCFFIFVLVYFILHTEVTISAPMGTENVTQSQPSNSEDNKTYERAKGNFQAKNLEQARAEFTKLRDRSGWIGENARNYLQLIDEIARLNSKLGEARSAVLKNQFDKACALLLDIEASVQKTPDLNHFYKDIDSWKEKSGGCRPIVVQPSDTLKADYEKALELKENGRRRDARSLLDQIRIKKPQYRDVEKLIREIDSEIEDEKNKSVDQRISEMKDKTKSLLAVGEFRSAWKLIKSARKLRLSDAELLKFEQEIRQAVQMEEAALTSAFDTFYSGKYLQAHEQLESFLKNPHSPTITALARFYQAAAIGSDYFLTGANNQEKKAIALKLFTQALKDDPQYSPQLNRISPKIVQLYAEATNKKSENSVKPK